MRFLAGFIHFTEPADRSTPRRFVSQLGIHITAGKRAFVNHIPARASWSTYGIPFFNSWLQHQGSETQGIGQDEKDFQLFCTRAQPC